MTQTPPVMVDVRETVGPEVGSYLIHYLLTNTSIPLYEAGQIGDRAVEVLQIAHDMALEFADLHQRFRLLQDYYDGNPPLAKQPARLTQKYRELLNMARSNWLGLVVDVVDERLQVGSIRSTAQNPQDKTAWKWWQANNMDGTAMQVHQAALKFGICYISVWPDGPQKSPKFIGESPLSTHVRWDTETDMAVAAIRIWQPECCDDVAYCDLTLPDYQFRFIAEGIKAGVVDDASGRAHFVWGMDFSSAKWRFRDDVAPVVRNALGRVPYERMRTMPDLLGGYRSEIEGLVPIQDRINKTNFDRMIAQEFTAFPQRWATGIDVPEDPKTGKPREPFDAAVDRVWTAEHPDARFGQFTMGQVENYLKGVTADVQALATQSRTPPHYLIAGMGQFPSGESVRATEYGLTRKIQARQQSYGDTWARVLRLGAEQVGNQRLANDLGLNVVWANVEARSEGEMVDALLKMASLNVPVTALWQRWGASPEEIQTWEELRLSDLAAQKEALGGSQATALLPSVDLNPSTAVSGNTPLKGERPATAGIAPVRRSRLGSP
jgi:hypothetical protein